MQRVLVIGSSGAGKSTFARRLGGAVGWPVIHLDQLFWEPGWKQAPPEIYRRKLIEAVAADRWIIDGNNSSPLDLRVPRADAIILMDRSRIACIARVLWRVATGYGRVRADMAEGCPEKLDWVFLKFVWNFPNAHGAKTREALTRHNARPRTIVLQSDREGEAFLAATTEARA